MLGVVKFGIKTIHLEYKEEEVRKGTQVSKYKLNSSLFQMNLSARNKQRNGGCQEKVWYFKGFPWCADILMLLLKI